MSQYDSLDHHPLINGLTSALISKTDQTSPHFFRLLGAYYFSMVAANMQANILTPDRGLMPINLYAVSLAPSGFGKGHGISIMEGEVMAAFWKKFFEETLPIVVEQRVYEMANERANRFGTSQDEELPGVKKDVASTGHYLPVFDSGTPAAFKQLRSQLLMTKIGCLNMRTDELGTHLSTIKDILMAFIESFDVGVINPKLVKHTKENERLPANSGRVPAMWLGFGTPISLLDGGSTENEFMHLLETGFARRCFFGHSTSLSAMEKITPEQIFDMRTNVNNSTFLHQLSIQIGRCADIGFHKRTIHMSKDIAIKLIEYELHNRERALALPEHDVLVRTELMHRHVKVLKLAGAYAFIDGESEITEVTLNAAIRMGEDSGKHFADMLVREPTHARLAKYLGTSGKPLTQAELISALPYYKGSDAARRDMMTLAIAYGLRHNISITRKYTGGIEEIQGTTLKHTNLSAVTFSYSTDDSQNYLAQEADFYKLHNLLCLQGYNWTSHQFKQGHRHSDDVISGFNLLILDVDNVVALDTAKLLLSDYTYCIHTTANHQKAKHGVMADRFRIVIPMSHTLKLSVDDHTLFMESVYAALPFKVDNSAKDIARKWSTSPGSYWYNTGQMWDVLPHIPATEAAEQQRAKTEKLYSLTHLERWFANNTANGNRSNQLFRYGSLLLDTGMDIQAVQDAVETLNDKLPEPIKAGELSSTVLRSLARAAIKADTPY